jgi:drug/metabolite transporter (DMT)-like permease
MSDTPPPPIQPRPAEQRSGCLTAFLIVCGIILLLPGLCSLLFVFGGLVKSAEDVQFVIALGLVGCGGVALIWWAVRRRGP